MRVSPEVSVSRAGLGLGHTPDAFPPHRDKLFPNFSPCLSAASPCDARYLPHAKKIEHPSANIGSLSPSAMEPLRRLELPPVRSPERKLRPNYLFLALLSCKAAPSDPGDKAIGSRTACDAFPSPPLSDKKDGFQVGPRVGWEFLRFSLNTYVGALGVFAPKNSPPTSHLVPGAA